MKYIIDYIIVFTDWLITAIKDILLLLWNVILIVVEAGKFLISVVTSLPALVTVPAVALVVACVLYKVLGREGEKQVNGRSCKPVWSRFFDTLECKASWYANYVLVRSCSHFWYYR